VSDTSETRPLRWHRAEWLDGETVLDTLVQMNPKGDGEEFVVSRDVLERFLTEAGYHDCADEETCPLPPRGDDAG
jgi:hypothetical protein